MDVQAGSIITDAITWAAAAEAAAGLLLLLLMLLLLLLMPLNCLASELPVNGITLTWLYRTASLFGTAAAVLHPSIAPLITLTYT